MAELKKLFEPLTVGSMTLKNRITLLPLAMERLDYEHYRQFILKIAEGGTALVVITYHGQDDRDDASFRYLCDLAKDVHARDSKIAGHIGTGYSLLRGRGEDVSVSEDFISSYIKIQVRAATIEEIHQYVRDTGETAERCYQAGFDAFELHIGMGYFLNRFLSTATNRRTDEYGGSMENRLRIVLECVAAIRSKVPRDFPLLCRFTPVEFMPGGLTWEDWKPLVPIMDEAGVDIWSVQPGWHQSSIPLVQYSVPAGTWLYLAEELKKVTQKPVITAYRITDPLVTEPWLAEGKADLIGLGRQLMADPYFANKAKEGRFDEIRPCYDCVYCIGGVGTKRELKGGESLDWLDPVCHLSAKFTVEGERIFQPATKAKKVLVIGGGAGGMEAAATAASRGHEVILYERGDRLGGLLLRASLPPYKDDTKRLITAMVTEVKKAGVKVELNTEVTSQLILDNKPDAVILATGAKPLVPEIPGSRGDNVVTAIEALDDVARVGKKVVVIGAGLVGCETAEFLATKGREVTILEMLPRLNIDVGRWVVRQSLVKANIVLETSLKAEEITPEGVRGVRDGNPMFFPADTVVLAAGFSANQELFLELQDKLPEVHRIGDCIEARDIRATVREGFFVGTTV